MSLTKLPWRPVTFIGGTLIALGSVTYGVILPATEHKPIPKTIAATKISYWVEGGDSVIADRLTGQLTKSGYTPMAANSPDSADIALATTQTTGAIPILETTTGAPSKLDSAKLVTPTTKPTYYLSTHARPELSAEKLDALATELKQSLKTTGTPSSEWSLAALGDIIIGRTVYLQIRRSGDPHKPFAHFADTIRNADLALADLECSISDKNAIITDGGMSFVSPFSAAAGLGSSGIDAVSISNNHSWNGGTTGFTDTLDEMARLGIRTFGGGRNDAEAHTPVILTVKGTKVALLGYSSIVGTKPATATTPGMADLSMAPWGPFGESQAARMEADIKAAKQQADLVFVYYHWGTEYTHNANADQRQIAHRAIDAGADLILGTHPHWVQGIEWYKDRLITYSLGNFIFDQEWSTKTKQGTFLKATYNGKTLTSAELVPYQIEDYWQPRPVNAATSQQILNDIFTHSWWPPL